MIILCGLCSDDLNLAPFSLPYQNNVLMVTCSKIVHECVAAASGGLCKLPAQSVELCNSVSRLWGWLASKIIRSFSHHNQQNLNEQENETNVKQHFLWHFTWKSHKAKVAANKKVVWLFGHPTMLDENVWIFDVAKCNLGKVKPTQMAPVAFSLSLCNLWGSHKGVLHTLWLWAKPYGSFWLYEFSKSLWILPPMSSRPLSLGYWLSIGSGQGTYVALNSFQSDHAGWLLHPGMVPTHGVTKDTFLLGQNLLHPPLRHQFPSWSIGETKLDKGVEKPSWLTVL